MYYLVRMIFLFHQKSKENRMQLVMILARQSTHMINQEQCQAQI